MSATARQPRLALSPPASPSAPNAVAKKYRKHAINAVSKKKALRKYSFSENTPG